MKKEELRTLDRLKKSLAYEIEKYQKLIDNMDDDCLLKEAAIKAKETAEKRLSQM